MYQNVSECIKMYQKCIRMYQNVSECIRMYQNVSEMYQNVSKCIRNVSKCIRNVSECIRMYQNVSEMYQTIVAGKADRVKFKGNMTKWPVQTQTQSALAEIHKTRRNEYLT